MKNLPGWGCEQKICRAGARLVAGLDEAGRGCLAGPVVAAAVILRPGARPAGVNDSKLLTASRRDTVLRHLLRCAEAWGIGIADAAEIDTINILNATRRAMQRAVEALPVRPDHLLIDALQLPAVALPQTPLIHGDRRSVSIASASVLAKVVRDRLMDAYDRLYPGFGFATHKGYGTPGHLAALSRQGACAIHRLTFQRVGGQREFTFVADGA